MGKRKPSHGIVGGLTALAVPIADLVADPRNARHHDNANLAAIEISPAYVAVTLHRFLDATGKAPELLSSGG